jgi:hypothetical protein
VNDSPAAHGVVRLKGLEGGSVAIAAAGPKSAGRSGKSSGRGAARPGMREARDDEPPTPSTRTVKLSSDSGSRVVLDASSARVSA